MPRYQRSTCAYCAQPFQAQVRSRGLQKYCSKDCFGLGYTINSIRRNDKKRQMLQIIYDEGLITREELRQKLGLLPRHFGRIINHLARDKRGRLFTYQIGLTARGKQIMAEFLERENA